MGRLGFASRVMTGFRNIFRPDRAGNQRGGRATLGAEIRGMRNTQENPSTQPKTTPRMFVPRAGMGGANASGNASGPISSRLASYQRPEFAAENDNSKPTKIVIPKPQISESGVQASIAEKTLNIQDVEAQVVAALARLDTSHLTRDTLVDLGKLGVLDTKDGKSLVIHHAKIQAQDAELKAIMEKSNMTKKAGWQTRADNLYKLASVLEDENKKGS